MLKYVLGEMNLFKNGRYLRLALLIKFPSKLHIQCSCCTRSDPKRPDKRIMKDALFEPVLIKKQEQITLDLFPVTS